MNERASIILAAGKGVRMQSELPKVFHNLLGRPMLSYVIETVRDLGIKNIYVVAGYKKEIIEEYFKDWGVIFVHQDEQLGTGHAVQQAEPAFKKNKTKSVLVLAGDVPLLKAETLKRLI